MGWLALVLVVVVLGDSFVRDESPFDTIFTVVAWVIWAAFAAEYIVRLAIAESLGRFFARTWWQLIFLALPFLGFVRIVAALRIARAGRVVSAGVRSARTATQSLSNRLVWLGAITVLVILLATDLLYEFAGVRPYGQALHDVAIAAIGGQSLGHVDGIAQVLDVALVLYSVVVFAALAGALGAFFLQREPREQ